MADEVVDAPTIETPAAVPSAPAAIPTVNESRRDVIVRAMNAPPAVKAPAARAEDGKFISPAAIPAVQAAKFPVPSEPSAPAVTESPKTVMPKSLKLELQQHWEKTPAELQAAIAQREQDFEKGVQPLKAKAQQADELLNEFKPYEMLLKMENTTPRAAIAPLLQTAAILRTGTPAQKAQAVVQTMQQFGIPIEHLQQMLGGNAPTQPALDPQFSQLAQEVRQLTAAQQQQQNARVMQAIKEFAANPEHKHFEAVSDRMAALLQTPQVLGAELEGMTEPEQLKLAYDMAIRLDPAIFQQVLTEQQVKEKAKNQVEQAKNAAVQVKGAPAAAPTPKLNPNDRRELLKNAFHASR